MYKDSLAQGPVTSARGSKARTLCVTVHAKCVSLNTEYVVDLLEYITALSCCGPDWSLVTSTVEVVSLLMLSQLIINIVWRGGV